MLRGVAMHSTLGLKELTHMVMHGSRIRLVRHTLRGLGARPDRVVKWGPLPVYAKRVSHEAP